MRDDKAPSVNHIAVALFSDLDAVHILGRKTLERNGCGKYPDVHSFFVFQRTGNDDNGKSGLFAFFRFGNHRLSGKRLLEDVRISTFYIRCSFLRGDNDTSILVDHVQRFVIRIFRTIITELFFCLLAGRLAHE